MPPSQNPRPASISGFPGRTVFRARQLHPERLMKALSAPGLFNLTHERLCSPCQKPPRQPSTQKRPSATGRSSRRLARITSCRWNPMRKPNLWPWQNCGGCLPRILKKFCRRKGQRGHSDKSGPKLAGAHREAESLAECFHHRQQNRR